MKFGTIQDAYNALANYLISFCESRPWNFAVVNMKIYKNMARGKQWLEYNGEICREGGFSGSDEAIWNGLAASKFIRDDILEKTGQRIWGLTFTLEPTGKFKIDFDYNKPEGYEESDEVITGDEINQSLRDLTQKKGDSASS